MKTAVIMPSMRGPKSLESFIEIASPKVDFIVISQEKLEKKYERTIVFNEKEVFEKSWIFNRITKRNFGFLYAYKQDYDVIITVDDDCFPESKTFFDDHINKLKNPHDDHFNVLNAYSNIPNNVLKNGCRGHPTSNQKKYPIVINQGLWFGDIDLPATTIYELNSKNGKIPPPISTESKVIHDFILPKNQFTTFCGMNVSFLREVIPALPWAYQEPDGFGISRYDDIWVGLFAKKILDKLEKRMALGFPMVKHDKGQRNLQIDLENETKGNLMNNFLWSNLADIILEGKDYVSCFLEIANWLKKISNNPERTFLAKVSKAMYEWINLFDKF